MTEQEDINRLIAEALLEDFVHQEDCRKRMIKEYRKKKPFDGWNLGSTVNYRLSSNDEDQ